MQSGASISLSPNSSGSSWSRPTPLPFVNGRGNVSLTSTPRSFIPSPSLSQARLAATPSPRERESQGQQAYVRATSPTPGASNGGQQQRSPVMEGQGQGHVATSFPSEFGVRQRVALKRGSSAIPLTASDITAAPGLGGGGSYQGQRRTMVVTSESSGDGLGLLNEGRDLARPKSALSTGSTSRVSATRPPSDPPKGPLPTPPPAVLNPPSGSTTPTYSPQLTSSWSWETPLDRASLSVASGSDRRASRVSSSSSQGSTSVLANLMGPGDWNDISAGGNSPELEVPSATRPHQTSILDRPRPRTPEPFPSTSFSSTSSAYANRVIPIRSTSASPTERRPPLPTPPVASGSGSSKTSVLNRPRPRTPEPAFFTQSTPSPPLPSSQFPSTTSSHTSSPRAPNRSPYAPPLSNYSSYSNRSRPPTPSESPTSVLNRPRPKTPDYGSSYNSPSTYSSAPSQRSVTPTPSNAPYQTSPTARQHRPSLSSQSSSILDRPRPKTPDYSAFYARERETSSASSSSLPSSSASSLPRSFSEQSLDLSLHSGDRGSTPPTLELNIGALGGGDESMFDLASILSGASRVGTPNRNDSPVPSKLEAMTRKVEPEPEIEQFQDVEEEQHGEPEDEATPTTNSFPVEVREPIRERSVTRISAVPLTPEAGKFSLPQNFISKLERTPPPAEKTGKRRRSIASLLSFSSPKGKQNDDGDNSASLKTGEGSTDSLPAHFGVPSPPSVSSTNHSASESKGSLSSFASSGSSSHNHSTPPSSSIAHPPLTLPAPIPDSGSSPQLLLPSPFEERPQLLAYDKSLPPTPILPASPASTSTPFLPPTSAPSLPDDSPTKGISVGLQPSPNALRRGLSMLRTTKPSNAPGFQLVSATSSRRQAAGLGPVSHVPVSSSSNGASASTNWNKRLVDRFSPNSTHQQGKTSTGPTDSIYSVDSTDLNDLTLASVASSASTTRALDSDGEPKKAFPKPPRRASISGLLGEKKLGMSLGAARKSEDLLTTVRGRKSEDMLRDTDRDVVFDKEGGAKITGRGSFDLLTQRKHIPRRPSTDNLLNLATAKLSKLGLTKDKGKDKAVPPPVNTVFRPSTSSDSIDPSTSSPVSFASTASLERSPEKAAVTVAKRVVPDSPSLARSTAAPMLVRGDSLRTLQRPRASTPTPKAERHESETPTDSPAATPLAGPSPAWRKRVKIPDSGVGSDSSMSSAWLDIEDALVGYASAVQTDQQQRGNIVTNTLLPFLKREEDSPAPRPDDILAKRQRQVLFGWLTTLTNELREMQPSHRGACLEAVAAIAESRFMSSHVLADDPAGQERYRSAIVSVLAFAIEKLNDKAVYANTLVFSGRVFALAFFRIDGVALKLLRALPPVKRQGLLRILEDAGVSNPRQLPQVDLESFPSHLWPLCLQDFAAYTSLLLPPINRPPLPNDGLLVRDGDIVVEMSGNWLIRWTASDSDLPFAFYRAYHRQLAAHLIPPDRRESIDDGAPLSPTEVITAPGFLFLAASLLDKCDGLIKVNLRSVTSIGPNNGANFNTNDSANLNFGQKPKVLELANRRLVTTMLDIVGGPPPSPVDDVDVAPDADIRRHAFSAILGVWIRACVKRVSMWNTRGVFLLMDLVEGLIYTLSYPSPSGRNSTDDMIVPRPHESCIAMFDPSFIFSFVKTILATGDNTVAIMRTIAFVYAHFEIFTLRSADREELCENIILDEVLFPRLYLHWNPGVRGYFIRLLVWRLARLGVVAGELPSPSARDPQVVAIFGLMNDRLDAIRKRHDELEPMENLTDDDPFRPPKRSTICSTRGVKEAPFTVDEIVGAPDSDSDVDSEPQELVRETPAPNGLRKANGRREVATVATVARVVSWLKGGLGKARQNGGKIRPVAPEARIDPFRVHSETNSVEPLDDGESWAEGASTGLESASSEEPPEESWPSPSSPTKSSSASITTTPERRPTTPAFFSFEFEGGVPVVRPSTVDTSSESSSGSNLSVDTAYPGSPNRRNPENIAGTVSPRVSLRFSKRISILPPAALDMLKEGGNGVPQIPARFLATPQGYDKKLHPYALRGLKEYEDACEEWIDWTVRLQEEEDLGKKHNRGFIDTVPRLSVNWPSAFEDGGQ
ncbi:hypothetical protein P7C70_g1391, partial [Phenoliferia sp. Uapishka_3]